MSNNKRKETTIIIILLLVIIVILAVLCILFATDKITFNFSDSNDTAEKLEDDNDNQVDEPEEDETITEEEAISILNDAANKIGTISNGYPYCGENMVYDDVDAIFDENNISTHTASKDYTSLDELKDDLRNYMSDEMVSRYIEDTLYIEKDQKLYCRTYHRGAIIYDKANSSYNVDSITNDKIIASGVLSTMGEGGDSSKNNVSIEMTKVNDNWIITKYDVQ